MKRIALSTLVALTLGTVSVSATQLYTDKDGQVFTTAGEGRTALKAPTPVYSKADKLKFSGLTYLGLTHNDRKDTISTGANPTNSETNFELRRSYFQLKAYLLDDPKSYFRVTLDMHQNKESDMVVRAKYAYLYLNDILPSTGVEMGLVHRPWHDYEEHNAWYYRNISKVLIEASNGGHLSNSADFGVNFKTKTQYFDSEVGVFNGEGYHSDFNDDTKDSSSASNGMSLEWRTTAHLMGVNGKDKQTKKTYFDASFFGQYNKDHKSSASGTGYDDLIFYGLHTVYNQPSLLVSAQYITSEDTADNGSYVSAQAGKGYSVNGEYRFGHNYDYRAIARYDSWTDEKLSGAAEKEDVAYIVGGVWEQNKNVQWVTNVIVTDNEAGSDREKENGIQYMLTAEVKF